MSDLRRSEERGAQPGTPLLTSFLALAACLAFALPDWSAALAYDRSAILSGEVWRLFTAHVMHFSAGHLAPDLVMLIALGLVCECAEPRITRMALLLAAPAITLTLLACAPELEFYRGLSGLDAALFAVWVVHIGRTRPWLALVAALLFGAKLSFEAWTGGAVFVDAQAVFRSVPLAHLIGACSGLVASALLSLAGPIDLPRAGALAPFASARHLRLSRQRRR